jgi:hypothetical protein
VASSVGFDRPGAILYVSPQPVDLSLTVNHNSPIFSDPQLRLTIHEIVSVAVLSFIQMDERASSQTEQSVVVQYEHGFSGSLSLENVELFLLPCWQLKVLSSYVLFKSHTDAMFFEKFAENLIATRKQGLHHLARKGLH